MLNEGLGISRRGLLALAAAATPLAFGKPTAAFAETGIVDLEGDGLAHDEALWRRVAAGYTFDNDPTNLISGANNPAPQVVLEDLVARLRRINLSPLPASRGREASEQWERVRTRLAAMLRTQADEIVLTRSATEGANIVINGHPFARGDEILTTRHDYGTFKNALRMRADRDGLVLREVDWEMPIASQEQLVELITKAITPPTKMIMICHVLTGYGQILPVREIVRIAHTRGVRVLVDGAQAFGHIDVNLADLQCDFYTSSLHKWAGAPLGTGFLQVRRDLVASIRPLFGNETPGSGDVRKFETVGSKSVAPMLAVNTVLDGIDAIGAQARYARLRYLKHYWVNQLADDPRFAFLASPDDRHTGAIQSVEIRGRESRAVWEHLFDRHLNLGIHPYFPEPGLRSALYVAPNLFTMPADLDRLTAALRDIAQNGIPA